MTMKNETLRVLSEMVQDCLNDETITHAELVRTIRASLGDSVAYHTQAADKAQCALNDLNELQPATTGTNDLYWLSPGGAGSRDYVSTSSGADVITFTGQS